MLHSENKINICAGNLQVLIEHSHWHTFELDIKSNVMCISSFLYTYFYFTCKKGDDKGWKGLHYTLKTMCVYQIPRYYILPLLVFITIYIYSVKEQDFIFNTLQGNYSQWFAICLSGSLWSCLSPKWLMPFISSCICFITLYIYSIRE